MSIAQSDFVWSLQLQVKSLTKKVEAFKSGSQYQKMNSDICALDRKLEQQKKSYEKELSRAHAETASVRNRWFQVFEDLQEEHEAELAARDREIESLKKRILEVERQRDEALTKVTEQRRELYSIKTELEEEKGRTSSSMRRSTVTLKTLVCLLPCHRTTRRSPTVGRVPGKSPAHSRGMRGTLVKDRNQRVPCSSAAG